MKRSLVLVASAGLLAAVPAFAAPTTLSRPKDPKWIKDGSTTKVTEISGNGGTRTIKVVGPFDWNGGAGSWPNHREVGLRGVQIWENADRPCMISTHFGKLMGTNGATTYRYPKPDETTARWESDISKPSVFPDVLVAKIPFDRATYTGCISGNQGTAETAWVARTFFGQERKVVLNNEMFVQGIQVCTNDTSQTAKRKLKGVRLFGAKFDQATGKPIPLQNVPSEGHESYALPNCKNWNPKVSCASNQLATGVHYQVNEEGSLSGLALACSSFEDENK